MEAKGSLIMRRVMAIMKMKSWKLLEEQTGSSRFVVLLQSQLGKAGYATGNQT